MIKNEKPLRYTIRQSTLLKAKEMVKNISKEDWPEDDWFTVTKTWDLNVWTERYRNCIGENEVIHYAALYKVINGVTKTNDYIMLVGD